MTDRPDRRIGVRVRPWLIDYPRLLPLGAFAIVTLFALISVFAIERADANREAAWLEEIAVQKGTALSHGISSTASLLRIGAVLLPDNGRINEQEFSQFAGSALDDPQNYGMRMLGWARLDYDAGTGSDTNIPMPARLIIEHASPASDGDGSVIGHDLYADASARAVVGEAIRLSRPVASGMLKTVKASSSDARSFAIVMPVFLANGITGQPTGFLFGLIDAQDYFDASLNLHDGDASDRGKKLSLQLFDGPMGSGQLIAASQSLPSAAYSTQKEVMIANRPMTLSVGSDRSVGMSDVGLVTLMGGLIAGGLLALILRLLAHQLREDALALERMEEQSSIRDSLTLELNHRVKNTLANILSIISLTRRRASDVNAFADGLDRRVRALSATHDLLTQSEWGTTPIADIVTAELGAYAHDDQHAVTLGGPDLRLAPKDALSLGLALHELIANASKFGSLSQSGGRLDVTWSLVSDTLAQLQWIESGGPSVPTSPLRGFGLELIEKITAHELRHPVELSFDENGVCCRFLFSVRMHTDFALREHHTLRKPC